MRRLLGTVLLAVFASAADASQQPKNVILVIGDGLGLAHITAMRNLRGEQFQLGRFRHVGLVATPAADSAVTDSAAAASAYATGSKANYEALSVDPKTNAPLPTVLELAEKKGRSTGLVTTAMFADATVAAFAAHVSHRSQAKEIIIQMLESGAEVIVGAGLEELGKDGLPSIETLRKESGYTIVEAPSRLWDVPKSERVMGIFPTVPRTLEWADAPLARLTQWAIDRLSLDPDGFFLVVESEAIDGASHQNFNADLRPSLERLDAAAGVALDFAARRNDTLVLVTGDHETGGLRISETRQKKRWRIEFSTTDHTGTMIPIFAFGPGAEQFIGFQENTDVGKKLLAIQK